MDYSTQWVFIGCMIVGVLGLLSGSRRKIVSTSNFNEALAALRELHDEQNGPPLQTRRKQWQEAYDKAIEVLQKYGA